MNNELLVQVQAVHKQYRTGDELLPILEDVHLQVASGETVAVTGESGCGKSTLLNMISGLDRPSSGQVLVERVNVSALRESAAGHFRNQVLGMVFQSHHLLRDFTLLENVAMPGLIAGMGFPQAQEKALELLDRVGIADRQGHFPNAVSGGERQRAAVARALINDPRLILADEPTGNLDERHSEGVQQLLFEIVRSSAAALVLVTHDRRFAANADRSFILHRGSLEEA
ncbi:ABC transporter ATP-binding protein [Spirochaeta africana]|uniref:ABC-type antimicrobial peptide transport system, ATPase component n=1 Tax=Spirochaeta africana (strain ATCC 700263 / DSM 8902 / Z-7692) TaxID=889378 RepID=H9UI05_SPIAZ|nr:ABC transporter ATP-binding protein [Spirochaeta africana]AFG37148.1 ABC-type antimicrobial peptide transport system, ATPase component [Spirochaeta africana DSM 8902]